MRDIIPSEREAAKNQRLAGFVAVYGLKSRGRGAATVEW